jgi:hypothetical protein
MNRLPPVTSSSTILVTVTAPTCHFIFASDPVVRRSIYMNAPIEQLVLK